MRKWPIAQLCRVPLSSMSDHQNWICQRKMHAAQTGGIQSSLACLRDWKSATPLVSSRAMPSPRTRDNGTTIQRKLSIARPAMAAVVGA